MSKLIPKYLTAWGTLNYSAPQDNTRVAPIYLELVNMKPKVIPTLAQLSSDDRSKYLKEKDEEKTTKLNTDYKKVKDTERAVKNFNAFTEFSDKPLLVLGAGELAVPTLKWLGSKALFNKSFKKIMPKVTSKKDMLVINNTLIKDLSEETFNLYKQKFNQAAINHPDLIHKYSRPVFLKINGEPEYFALGEYFLPNWLQFYKSTIYPNRIIEHAKPDAMIPKLSIRLKNDNISGDYLNNSKKTFIAINSPSNKQLVGLHEYISHGTDYAADPGYWSDLFYPSFMKFSEMQKLPWYEIRATVNEAKYQVFDKAQKYYNKKNLTQKEFHDYVDKLSDTAIAQSLYHKNRPINVYAKDVLDLLNSAKNIKYDNYVIDRLRHAFKYGFIGTGVTSSLIENKKKIKKYD